MTNDSRDSFVASYDKLLETPLANLTARRDTRFYDLQTLIAKCGMSEYCEVHPEFLWWAILDYFKDIEHLKKRHGSIHTHIDKIYAYELYWYLHNNVIQVTNIKKQMQDKQLKEHPHRLFVNEYILSYWVLKSLGTELKSNLKEDFPLCKFAEHFDECFDNHKSIVEFRTKLFYTFRYRTYTQESFLLAFEGLKAGFELACSGFNQLGDK